MNSTELDNCLSVAQLVGGLPRNRRAAGSIPTVPGLCGSVDNGATAQLWRAKGARPL